MDFKNDYAELRGSEATKQSVAPWEWRGVKPSIPLFFGFLQKKVKKPPFFPLFV